MLSEKNIANVLLSLAGPLGMQFEETMPADARLELLLRELAELQKPCLLVIDNANELEDLEKITKSCAVALIFMYCSLPVLPSSARRNTTK